MVSCMMFIVPPLVFVIEPEAVGVPGRETDARAMCPVQSSPTDSHANPSAGYQPSSG